MEEYVAGDGSIIENVTQTKDLGIMMTTEIDFREQITEVKNRGRRMSGWILRTFNTRDELLMLTLFKSLVLPILEYACVLWSPQAVGQVREIESVQRYFTSKINNMSNLNYWERLRSLKIFSLERRRDRYAIIYVMKILKGIVPNFTENEYKIQMYNSGRRGLLCKIPDLKSRATARLKSIKDRSFAVKGPKLFNTIPFELRNCDISMEVFKSKLDKWLLQIPDRPCLPNYQGQNAASNSVIDQANNIH